MQPDIEKYRRYVDHFDISEDQKIDLIHTVYRMMQSFVDRAFGIDSAQQNMALKVKKAVTSDIKMIECSKQSDTNNPPAKQLKMRCEACLSPTFKKPSFTAVCPQKNKHWMDMA